MLVLDTSVILNLLGTSRPKLILSHLSYQVIAPPAVIKEVLREPEIDIEKDATFSDLLKGKLIQSASVNEEVETLAIALAGAPRPDDLGDGESYAIACAVCQRGTIGIDERKARRVISTYWPTLPRLFSLEIIEIAVERARLEDEQKANVIFHALRSARMRIPADRRADIIELIGRDRARLCPSLGYF